MANPRFRVEMCGNLGMKSFIWVNHTLDLVFRWDPSVDCWVKERFSTGKNVGSFISPETAMPSIRRQFYHEDTEIL